MGDGYVMGLRTCHIEGQMFHIPRYYMGNHRARPEPILFLPVSFCHCFQQRRAATLFPYGPIVGENCAELEDLRHLN